jgi:hypothetical protein
MKEGWRQFKKNSQEKEETIAANIFTYLYNPTAENPADILSKHWAYNQVWESLREILFSANAP